MSKKIWVNRALVLIAVSVIALLAFAAQHFGALDIRGWIVREPPEVDYIAYIEENGHVDILYYGIGEYESNLLGATPTAALGIAYYPPTVEQVDAEYHVYLTDTGWKIIRGKYDWSPDMEEEYQDKIHAWNFTKMAWYSDNAMFKPGQLERVFPALFDLLDWYQDKVFCDFLYRVFVWAESTGVEWNALEIDFLSLQGPMVLPGYTTESGTGYVIGFYPSLNGTIVMFKMRKEEIFVEGKWVEIQVNPVQEALDAGELTEEAFVAIVEARQLQAVGAMTFLGPRQYAKGFNHPWQGRELAEEGAT